MIEVTLPLRIHSRLNERKHWSVYATRSREQRHTAYTMLRAQLLFKVPPGPITVTLTRIAPRLLDDDNAIGGFKSVRDGIADWFERDDGDPSITWKYGQQKGKGYAVQVRIDAGD